MKYIFVDLDNTLINAEYLVSNPPRNSKVITVKNMYHTERYWARVRPGALELLTALRLIGPVYMLTAAMESYARAWNKEFDLGFKEKDIYAREDSDAGNLIVSEKFPKKGKVFLIDDKDLPYLNTVIKERFLKGICNDKVNIVKIKPYLGHLNQSLGIMQITEILGKLR